MRFTIGSGSHHGGYGRYHRHRGIPIDPSSTLGKTLLWMFVVIGLAMMVGAGVSYKNTKAFLATAEKTQGQVVELEYRRGTSTDSRGTYYPIIAFHLPDGGKIRFQSNSGSYPAAYDVGERVNVTYDPVNPNEARIDSTFGVWGLPIILSGLGVVFVLVAGFGLTAAGRKANTMQRLRQNGVTLEAEVVNPQEVIGQLPGFIKNMVNSQISPQSIPGQGGGTSFVLARWHDPNTGANHWFTEGEWTGEKPPFGSKVKVLVDRSNTQVYTMSPEMQ